MPVRRSRSVVGALCLVLAVGAPAYAEPVSPGTALARSLAWLETHPPDGQRDRIGDVCLDLWAWVLFATRHPDPDTRERAGAQADRRLRSLRLPATQTLVTASYWAVLLRLMAIRGIDDQAQRARLIETSLDDVLRDAQPTTRFFVTELFRRSGVPAPAPDFSKTFVATAARTEPIEYSATKRDAYQLFHELVPATDFGRAPLSVLTPEQAMFVRRVLPDLLKVSLRSGDTDAVAETLVSAALMDDRERPYYHEGLLWLLSRQRPDGTYASARDGARPRDPDHFRHVVLVASYAVLTSL